MSAVRRRALVALVVVVALGVGTAVVARAVKSPAQRAAEARPPAVRPVLETVTAGPIAQSATVDCTNEAVAWRTFGGDADSAGRVTRSAPVGRAVQAFSSVVEVDGRPRLAVPTDFPFYRTLRVGDVGPDTVALRTALGVARWPVDLRPLDAAVMDRVSWWYAAVGSTAPRDVTPEDEAAARAAVRAAEDATAIADSPENVTALALARRRLDLLADRPVIVDPAELWSVGDRPDLVVSSGPSLGQSLSEAPVVVASTAAQAVCPIDAASAGWLVVDATGELTGDGAPGPAHVTQLRPAAAPPPADGGGTEGADSSPGAAAGSAAGSAATSADAAVVVPDQGTVSGATSRFVVQREVGSADELLIPVTGVYTAADGSTFALVRRDGATVRVDVEVIGITDGTVRCRSLDGAVAVGTRVIVGAEARDVPSR